jgi:hypothetical protein
MRVATVDIQAGARSRAAELSDDLEERVLRLVANASRIPVGDLRVGLEPKLTDEQRSLLPLAIYNLINSKRLVLTAGRELQLPSS